MATTAYAKVPAREQELGQADEDGDGQPTLTTSVSSSSSPQNELEPDLPLEPSEPDDGSYETEDSNLECSIDEAIERLGMGRFQVVILTAAGLCFAADAMMVLQLTFLSEVLRSEWNLNDDETAMIASILFIGSIFGTLALGPLADKKGRKPVFLLAAFVISCFGVAVAAVTEYWALLGCLFVVGWGVGGLTVPFDILAEFLPSSARGKNLLVIEYFWTVGVLFVVCVAYFTLGDALNNWRLFVAICSIPCWLSVIVGYFFVPESPRWLYSQGRYEEAMEVIRYAAERNSCDVTLLYPQGMRLKDDEESEESNFCELFSPRWRWTTFKLWGAWACFAFGYYGTVMAITEIFDSKGDPGTDDEVGMGNHFDYGAIFVSNSAELLGTSIAIFGVDRFGRIPLQVVSYALAGVLVCSLYLAAAYDFDRTVLICFGFGARIFEMMGTCVTWVSTAEILTTEVRTTGHSAANAVARIGSLSSPFLIEGGGSLVKKGLIMLAIHMGTVIFVSRLPETNGSRMGLSQDNFVEPDDEDDDDSDRDDFFDDEDVQIEVD